VVFLWVLLGGVCIALLTRVVVRASLSTVPAHILNDFAANRTVGSRRVGVSVVQVVEHHAAAVLGPSEGVELVVSELTHLQIGVSAVYERVGYVGVWIARVVGDAAGERQTGLHDGRVVLQGRKEGIRYVEG